MRLVSVSTGEYVVVRLGSEAVGESLGIHDSFQHDACLSNTCHKKQKNSDMRSVDFERDSFIKIGQGKIGELVQVLSLVSGIQAHSTPSHIWSLVVVKYFATFPLR